MYVLEYFMGNANLDALFVANSWHRRGLGGGLMLPPSLSPARQAIIPFIRHFLNGTGTGILEFIVRFT
jgi:hypothetical protein